jgi:glutamate/aspartate transport system substrate-binding protein
VAGNTLDKIKAAKTITLGVRNSAPPFASIDAAGTPSGFTWELCQAIVRSLSDSLKTPLQIKVVPVSLNDSFELLRNGQIDLQCGSTTHTTERAEKVDFSYTFFVSGVVTAYRTDDVKYASPSEFGRAGALSGSTAAKAVAVRTQSATVQRTIKELVMFASYAEGLEMLKSGKIDTLTADSQLLPTDPAIAVRRQQITVEPYALMMRKGDTAFVKAVDQALVSIMLTPAISTWAANAKLRVNYMTRDAWVHPGRTPAPPQF